MKSHREVALLGNYRRRFIHILSCFLIVWCSVTHALYENGGPSPLIDTSIKEVPSIDIPHESLSSPSQDPESIVWEYFVTKYSSSSSQNRLTSEELLGIAKSMQKCPKSSSSQGNTDSRHAKDYTDVVVPLPHKKSTQASNCNKILDSITLSWPAYHNQSSFQRICQRLLYYAVNPECCIPASSERLANGFPDDSIPSSATGDSGPSSTIFDSRLSAAGKKEKPTSGEVCGYGFLLVTIISCSSLVGVSLMPFMAKEFYKHLLTVMIGLAVGSLTGSAVFHLLPQALRLAESDPDHKYLNISLYIVGGIWLFFMVERILKFIMDYKERKGKSWKREKMSSVLSSTPESSTIAMMTENGNLMKGALVEANGGGEQRNSLIFPSAPRDTGVIYECQEQAIKASFGHQEDSPLYRYDHNAPGANGFGGGSISQPAVPTSNQTPTQQAYHHRYYNEPEDVPTSRVNNPYNYYNIENKQPLHRSGGGQGIGMLPQLYKNNNQFFYEDSSAALDSYEDEYDAYVQTTSNNALLPKPTSSSTGPQRQHYISTSTSSTPRTKAPTTTPTQAQFLGERVRLPSYNQQRATSTPKYKYAYINNRPSVQSKLTTERTTMTTNADIRHHAPFPFNLPKTQDSSIYNLGIKLSGCNVVGKMYSVGDIIEELSSDCVRCMCSHIGVHCAELSC